MSYIVTVRVCYTLLHIFHERTKHLDIVCHLVHEKLQVGLMRLIPVSSQAQVVDVFTKASNLCIFHDFLFKLGMVDIYHPPACKGVSNLD